MLKMTSRKTVNMWWTCLLLLFPSDLLGCKEGFFGSRCQFKCHCRDGCDETGACVGHSPCVAGWFGPWCQYFDVAVSGNVTWGREVPGERTELTDGNDNTCLRDQQRRTSESNEEMSKLKISWKEAYQITWVRFIGIMYLQNMTLAFETTSKVVERCTNQRITTVSDTTVDVHCDLRKDVMAIFMLFWHSNYTLCSVHISGGRNVAIKERATQSSNTGFGKYSADRAVDGLTRNSFAYGEDTSCTHTFEPDRSPHWDLYLSRPVDVNWVQIYNRGDCCAERLKGFIIEIFSSSFEYRYQDTSPEVRDVYTLHKLMQGVSRIRIRATNVQSLILTLCEVEVYGEHTCPKGSYGLDCELRCNCATEGEQCYVDTGDCPSGCAPGYYGEACSKECPNRMWGVDCADNCNVRCVNGLCNRTTGLCDNGCIRGYQPPSCDKECSYGYYGNNCSQKCPPGCSDKGCSNTLGDCYGCTSGYQGDFCNFVCAYGHHGNNCSQTCPVGCLGGGCDHVTGQCYTCVTGYQGATCEQVCYDGYYGNNCSQPCSVGCTREECDHVTGRCFGCVPGYHGDTCDTECDHGQWGDNCSNSCNALCLNSSCDHVSGLCHKGCVAGYQEPNCTEACAYGYYGNNCSLVCPDGCSSAGCQHVIGHCLTCLPGLQGDRCDEGCQFGKWGQNCSESCDRKCVNNSCDRLTGHCDLGCVAGYHTSPNCAEECSHGYYGNNCSSACVEHCLDRSCDPVTGHCAACVPGYHGDVCDSACPSGSHGNNCSRTCPSGCSRRGCDHVTGHCYGCIHGYQDPSCDTECDFGQWGPGCSQSCNSHCLGGSCDHVTGQCDKGCVAGYLPPNCTGECGHGQWGVNCNNPCHILCFNGSCDHVTGQCACEPGGQSKNCTQVERSTSGVLKSLTPGATLGISLASVTMVIVLAAIVVYVYRRKRKLSTDLSGSATELCPDILSMDDDANVPDEMMTNDGQGLLD